MPKTHAFLNDPAGNLLPDQDAYGVTFGWNDVRDERIARRRILEDLYRKGDEKALQRQGRVGLCIPGETYINFQAN